MRGRGDDAIWIHPALLGLLVLTALLYLCGLGRSGWANSFYSAVGNTAANRRLTFGVAGRRGAGRHQMQGLIVFGLGLALTSGSLALLAVVAPAAGHPLEVGVLVVANLAATLLRFLLLRAWIFRRTDEGLARVSGTPIRAHYGRSGGNRWGTS